jgi:hypothetical protein
LLFLFLSIFSSLFLFIYLYSLLVSVSLSLNFCLFVVCSVSFSLFLCHYFFSSSRLSASVLFLLYLLPSFPLLFVCFLVSLLLSTVTTTSRIPVSHCLLRFAETFSCCSILIFLVPDFMGFDQEFVEVQIHNSLRSQPNFSLKHLIYSL